jgi:2,5-diamino-6-(ribosylamino)-4(3H)-pyrimidinone 5'-phosphate reductase
MEAGLSSFAPKKPTLRFSDESRAFIDPYLHRHDENNQAVSSHSKKPFLTVTYAQSMDSKLSLAPGVQTILSGPETKAMTHYLRSRHDAILVGVGTAIADDPALNCRLEGVDLEGQPRPVIIDSKARWSPRKPPGHLSACMGLAQQKLGKGPWIMTSRKRNEIDPKYMECAEYCSGAYISLTVQDGEMNWEDILTELGSRGITSLMVEGGATVINALLQQKYLHLIDAIIITVAPVWLGDRGVHVSPPTAHASDGTAIAAARLRNVKWQQFGSDIVMCGQVENLLHAP